MPEADSLSVEETRVAELLHRAATGSAEALMRLVEEHEGPVLKVIRRLLKQRIRVVVSSQDLVQEVRVGLLTRKLRREIFHSRQVFLAYLRTIAKNLTRNTNDKHLAKKKRSLLRQERLEEANAKKEIAARHPDPARACEMRDSWDRFCSLLPPTYRGVLALLAQGFSQIEVAEELAVSTKTVTRMLQRVRRTIARCPEW